MLSITNPMLYSRRKFCKVTKKNRYTRLKPRSLFSNPNLDNFKLLQRKHNVRCTLMDTQDQSTLQSKKIVDWEFLFPCIAMKIHSMQSIEAIYYTSVVCLMQFKPTFYSKKKKVNFLRDQFQLIFRYPFYNENKLIINFL